MIEPDLPVFPFRPNWKDTMPEKLSFLTDVLTSGSGAEQRRSIRQTPRRSFQTDFLLSGPERTFWDLFINRLGGSEVYAPLYWEAVTLRVGLTALVSDGVTFDTSYTEWAYTAGDYALLMGKTALSWEVVQIESVSNAGVAFTAPVDSAWPVGTKLVPLRRCALDQVGDLTHVTAAVANVTAELRINGPNPWTPAADDSDTFGGLPVFDLEPNWVDDLTVTFTRDQFALLDTNVGLTYQVDPLGRALLGQAHRWFLVGRQPLALFRDFLYRHRGRAKAFWLPTFKADFKLAAAITASNPQITVENTGFGYTGGPTSGREYLAIKTPGGMVYRKITSVIPGTTKATEKLVLDSPVGQDLAAGQVRLSFMDTARFDTDDFEITHHAGIDSLHEVSATFRTFKNTRTAPTPISFPIPTALTDNTPCGTGVRAGPWKYLPIAKDDSALRSAKNFDDSSWAYAEGPFGNNPGGGSGSRPAPNTYLAPNTACWFRCRVPRGVLGMTIAQDDVSDVWFNGTKIGPQYSIGEATILFPDTGSDDNVCAVRVIDSVGTYIYFWDSMPHDPVP